MNAEEMAQVIAQLAQARRTGARLDGLAATPGTVAQAHAVQDRVAAELGLGTGGFKANAPPGEAVQRGRIAAGSLFASPARIAPASAPGMEVEGEIAFRFLRDLPPRLAAYSREEVAAAAAPLPAVEVVCGRFADWRARPALEQLADCLNNGALVAGAAPADWTALDLRALPVTARLNGEIVWQGIGGHPIGDPLGVAVALVNLQRAEDGVKAGQLVTTGSCTGIRTLRPGDRFEVAFAGLGYAALELSRE